MKLQVAALTVAAALAVVLSPSAGATTPFSLSAGSVDFGGIPVNTTQTKDVTVTIGSGYIAGTPAIDTSSGDAVSLSADTCAALGGAGGTCTLTFSLTPDAVLTAPYYADFVVPFCTEDIPVSQCTENGNVGSASVLVTGSGVSVFSAAPTSLAFGDVPLNSFSTAQTVTVTLDAGYAWLGVSPLAPFGLSGGSCGSSSVGPGTCTVQLTMVPTSVGSASGNAIVSECPVSNCTAVTSIQAQVALTGNGISVLSAAPSSLDFSNVAVGTTATQTVTITIDSGYTLSRVYSTSNPSFGVGNESCSGGTCSAGFTFSPTALGAANGQITLSECAATDTSCLAPLTTTVSLQGNGVNPVADLAVAIAAAPTPVQNKKPVTFTITVSNHGPNTATGVIANNTLPTASAFVSYSSSQGSCTIPPIGSTGTMVCSLGTLTSGATATIKATVTPSVKNNNLISVTATVSEDSAIVDPTTADNSATATAQVK